MANVKKTAPVKPEVEAPAAEAIVNEKKEKPNIAEVIDSVNKSVDEVANVSEIKKVSRRADIPLDEEIAVKSATTGGLNWINPTSNAYYRWNDIGEVEYIPFGEFITLNNSKPNFLRDPLVILDDQRVIEYFRLGAIYEKFAVVNSLKELFEEGDIDKVRTALQNIRNTNMRDVAISKIKELRRTNVLNNIDIIELVEQILCFDLRDIR